MAVTWVKLTETDLYHEYLGKGLPHRLIIFSDQVNKWFGRIGDAKMELLKATNLVEAQKEMEAKAETTT
jgi:hypothetical protein